MRRFKVETTFDGVEMSAVCRIVANTMTVTITKPHYEVMLRKHKLTEIVFEYVKQILNKALAEKFPEKSEFEK